MLVTSSLSLATAVTNFLMSLISSCHRLLPCVTVTNFLMSWANPYVSYKLPDVIGYSLCYYIYTTDFLMLLSLIISWCHLCHCVCQWLVSYFVSSCARVTRVMSLFAPQQSVDRQCYPALYKGKNWIIKNEKLNKCLCCQKSFCAYTHTVCRFSWPLKAEHYWIHNSMKLLTVYANTAFVSERTFSHKHTFSFRAN